MATNDYELLDKTRFMVTKRWVGMSSGYIFTDTVTLQTKIINTHIPVISKVAYVECIGGVPFLTGNLGAIELPVGEEVSILTVLESGIEDVSFVRYRNHEETVLDEIMERQELHGLGRVHVNHSEKEIYEMLRSHRLESKKYMKYISPIDFHAIVGYYTTRDSNNAIRNIYLEGGIPPITLDFAKFLSDNFFTTRKKGE